MEQSVANALVVAVVQKNPGSALPLGPGSRWASVAQWLTICPPKSAVFAGEIPPLSLPICSLLRFYGQLTVTATWRTYKRRFLSAEITIQNTAESNVRNFFWIWILRLTSIFRWREALQTPRYIQVCTAWPPFPNLRAQCCKQHCR